MIEEGGLENPVLRSPSTPARLLLFLLALTGSWVLLLVGFPPGAPDRLPVLLIALGLAFLSARRPELGVVAFAFLFPCVGLFVRLFGSTDPSTWPALLLGGLATGWTFRFIYDFESAPEPCSLDAWLKGLLVVWILSTAVAAARARTLWAALHGLSGRAVNGQGLLDYEAIRESVFSLAALAAGAAFYFLLRRSGVATRERAARAAVWGVAVSAAAAILERFHALPAETRPYWRLTRRLSGGAVDPNSLGLLCGLVIVLALTRGVRRGARGIDLGVVAVLIVGLLLSGSRSGFLLVFLSLAVLAIARSLPGRVRLAGLVTLGAILVLMAVLVVRVSPGTLTARMVESFDSKLPFEYRVSARPILWRAAAGLFLRHPIEGAGMGSFAWRLPDLAGETRRLLMRDNPGSAYVQALAETGLAGLLLTAAFAAVLCSQAIARIRALERDPLAGSAGVGIAAFLLASLFGSHWFAPDAGLAFFLLASVVAGASAGRQRTSIRTFRLLAIAIYAIAAAAAVIETMKTEETFHYSWAIGFHERETGPDGPFRWTRKNFAVWVPEGQSRRLLLAHFPPLPQPVDLTASVDGSVVFRHSFPPGEAVLLRVTGGARRARAIVFSLSRVFVPKRLRTGDDRRELGLRAFLQD